MGNILQALPQAATHLILIHEVITPLQKATPSYSIFSSPGAVDNYPPRKPPRNYERLDLEAARKYINLVCLPVLQD